LVALDQPAILKHQRNIVHAVIFRQSAFGIPAVSHNHEARDTPLRLAGSVSMQMRVEPVERDGLLNRDFRLPLSARCYQVMGSAIEDRRYEKPMPMQGRLFIHAILDGKGDCFTVLQAHQRAEIGTIDASGCGFTSVFKAMSSRLYFQFNDTRCIGLSQRWQRQKPTGPSVWCGGCCAVSHLMMRTLGQTAQRANGSKNGGSCP